MKKFLIIGVVIFCGLLALYLIFSNRANSYNGGYAPDGSYCDYGYNTGSNQCCDEDDYSCEVCDLYGIYCGEIGIQGFEDIDKIEERISSGDYNCSFFDSWESAEKVFIRDDGIKNDPYNLDIDRDGIACEHLQE